MIEKIFILLICHFIGDYVLQSNFIAITKGKSWYHLIVHSILYTVPFYLIFGWCWRLAVIGMLHFLIDALKARYSKINYVCDQALHLILLCVYLV